MSKESKEKHLKWQKEQKEKTGSLKKPITCKGKKPHDFVLLVPPYYRRNLPLTVEQTNMFYYLQERETVFRKSQYEAYEKLGLKVYSFGHQTTYFYKCSVCGKEKSEYSKLNNK